MKKGGWLSNTVACELSHPPCGWAYAAWSHMPKMFFLICVPPFVWGVWKNFSTLLHTYFLSTLTKEPNIHP